MLKEEKAQALVEFLMLVPIVMTFLWYLIHVSSAINKSIVGQKHARSQLFLKMFNHRSGPRTSDLTQSGRAMFYIGVSSENTSGSKVTAIAPIERLGIGPTPKKMENSDDDPGESKPNVLRQDVRVRTVFGICTQRRITSDGSGITDFCGTDSLDDGTGPRKQTPPSGNSAPSGV